MFSGVLSNREKKFIFACEGTGGNGSAVAQTCSPIIDMAISWAHMEHLIVGNMLDILILVSIIVAISLLCLKVDSMFCLLSCKRVLGSFQVEPYKLRSTLGYASVYIKRVPRYAFSRTFLWRVWYAIA